MKQKQNLAVRGRQGRGGGPAASPASPPRGMLRIPGFMGLLLEHRTGPGHRALLSAQPHTRLRPRQEDPEGCVPRHGARPVLTARAALGLERQQQWAEVPGGAFHRCPRACPRCHLSPHLNHTPTGLQGVVSGVGEGKRHNAGALMPQAHTGQPWTRPHFANHPRGRAGWPCKPDCSSLAKGLLPPSTHGRGVENQAPGRGGLAEAGLDRASARASRRHMLESTIHTTNTTQVPPPPRRIPHTPSFCG